MTTFNREKQLKQLHEKRKRETVEKVDAAIKRMTLSGKDIHFNSVAKESGVSKATLYANPELKERINFLKTQKEQAFVNHRIQQDENNQKAIIESLKRRIDKLERRNKELEAENKKLQGKENEKLADFFKQL